MSEFHHPYHFIPFDSGPDAGQKDLLREQFPNKAPDHVTHDRYMAGTKSGRLLCRLTTMTPIVVGGDQNKDITPTEVNNFEIGGRAAIPASTLRGLISNIAEAASNSAFRVLDGDRTYSYRKSVDDLKLSAMGMIHEHQDKLWLRPLTIPTLTADRNGKPTLDRGYEQLFPKPVLRVYLGDSSSIRDEHRAPKNTPPRQFLSLPLADRQWLPGYRLEDDQLQYPKPAATRRFVLSQKPTKEGVAPQPFAENPTWTPGIVRALGCWPPERKDSMPNTKKHELFLPVPTTKHWPVVALSDEVVESFQALCDERLAASEERWEREKKKNPLLPFEPYGTRPERYQINDNEKVDRRIRLKTGDVVYFRADGEGTIEEISFSSIWRGKVPGKASEFFPARLLPFYSNSEKDRKAELTPADLLFGFVEKRPKGIETERTALALASRLRFASAQAHETREPKVLDPVVRKILDSPKPPSPSFYFRRRQGSGAITKAGLKPSEHQAQGRKIYLHHQWRAGQMPWKSQIPKEDEKQKANIRPIDAGQEFFFHLDFDNLTEEEFRLLLYALRPSDGFQHKLGMGKALGLGSVRIDLLGYFEVDRQARYSEEGLDGHRYARAILGQGVAPESWPERYRLEKGAAASAENGLEQERDAYQNVVPAAVRRALELLGDPANLLHPVSQPLVEDNENPEKETFLWYVANERSGQPQMLRPIEANTAAIPTLRRAGRWTGNR